jgi:hypothetical protein
VHRGRQQVDCAEGPFVAMCLPVQHNHSAAKTLQGRKCVNEALSVGHPFCTGSSAYSRPTMSGDIPQEPLLLQVKARAYEGPNTSSLAYVVLLSYWLVAVCRSFHGWSAALMTCSNARRGMPR